MTLLGWLIPKPYLYIAAVLAVLALVFGIWKAGYNYRDKICDADNLRKELAVERARNAELTKQIAAGQDIQHRDAQRAQEAEDHARDLQTQLDATPVNSGPCLDRNAVGRVRRFK